MIVFLPRKEVIGKITTTNTDAPNAYPCIRCINMPARPVSATHRMPIGHSIFRVLLILMVSYVGVIMRPEMYRSWQETAM